MIGGENYETQVDMETNHGLSSVAGHHMERHARCVRLKKGGTANWGRIGSRMSFNAKIIMTAQTVKCCESLQSGIASLNENNVSITGGIL